MPNNSPFYIINMQAIRAMIKLKVLERITSLYQPLSTLAQFACKPRIHLQQTMLYYLKSHCFTTFPTRDLVYFPHFLSKNNSQNVDLFCLSTMIQYFPLSLYVFHFNFCLTPSSYPHPHIHPPMNIYSLRKSTFAYLVQANIFINQIITSPSYHSRTQSSMM